MVIVAKILCNRSFIPVIEKEGYIVHSCSEKAAVELPLLRRGNGREPDLYTIPYFVDDPPNLVINAREYGNYLKKTAQVVCGFSGKPLVPFFIKEGDEEKEAHFSVPRHIVTIEAESRTKLISIKIHKLYYQGLIAWIETEVLYSGLLHKIPHKMLLFSTAAQAAYIRAMCPLCRHTHYVASV
jgi:hypothetical protein